MKVSESNHENVYYGSVKYMPEGNLEKQLADARKTIAELTAEKERRSRFTSTELLADRLHRLLHMGTDCDYAYSDWPFASGIMTGCRAQFYELARKIEEVSEPFSLGQTLSLMERVRFGLDYVDGGQQ